jgi:hypothetical protein
MILVCLCAVTLGVGIGVFVIPSPVPTNLRPATVDGSVPVARESFNDERTVKAIPQTINGRELTWSGGGMVTALGIERGAVVSSGSSPFSVDDAPVLALYTAVPLYRDLSYGMVGSDVGALRDELMRLGFGGEVEEGAHNIFEYALGSALVALQERIGAEMTGALSMESCVWLPKQSIVLDEISLVWGQPASQSIGSTALSVTKLEVVLPEGSYPGDRVLDVGGIEANLSADGDVADVKFLDSIKQTSAFTQWANMPAEQRSAGLNAVVRLKTPLEAIKVPAGAVFGVNGVHACVRSRGKTISVDLYGSVNGFAMVGAENRDFSSVQTSDRGTVGCPVSGQGEHDDGQ